MLKSIRKPKSLYWTFQSLLAFQYEDHTLSQFFAWIEGDITASPITNSFFFFQNSVITMYMVHTFYLLYSMCTALFQNSCTLFKHIVLEHWIKLDTMLMHCIPIKNKSLTIILHFNFIIACYLNVIYICWKTGDVIHFSVIYIQAFYVDKFSILILEIYLSTYLYTLSWKHITSLFHIYRHIPKQIIKYL